MKVEAQEKSLILANRNDANFSVIGGRDGRKQTVYVFIGE